MKYLINTWELKIKQKLVLLEKYTWNHHQHHTNLKWFKTKDYLSLDDAKKMNFTTCKPKTRWGGNFQRAWFHYEMPTNNLPKDIEIFIKPDVMNLGDGTEDAGEIILYINDQIITGLNKFHKEASIPNELLKDDKLDIYFEAFIGNHIPGWSLEHDFPPPEEDCAKVNGVFIITENYDIIQLYYDVRALYETSLLLDDNNLRKYDILKNLDKELSQIDFGSNNLQKILRQSKTARVNIEHLLRKKNSTTTPIISYIGHSHIDIAWLWRIAETKVKCARTFSTMVSLMDKYPEFIFIQSQAVVYDYCKILYPKLYDKIKEKIYKGQWEVNGSMWVEPDCNITSGESLVRQILIAKNFFKKEFNKDNDILWLPDVFGYSAALPQILKQSNVNYFCTSKINWNQINKFPYTTFYWEGIDGTNILSSFISGTKSGYNGKVSPEELKDTWDYVERKDTVSSVIKSFGHGDGGGGVTREMIEMTRRLEDLEGAYKCKIQKASDFFRNLEKGAKEYPKWVGELYLEIHRGTYTTHGKIKRQNRKAEYDILDTELLSVLSGISTKDELLEAWKILLTNQFHDILPGSSITKVYEDADMDYARIKELTEKLQTQCMNRILDEIDTKDIDNPIVIFNPLSWNNDDVISIQIPDAFNSISDSINNQAISSQLINNNDNENNNKTMLLIENASIPSFGYKAFNLEKKKNSTTTNKYKLSNQLPCDIENLFHKINFNENAEIISIIDKKSDIEYIDGVANQFQLFQDMPMKYDAWDVDFYYDEVLVDNGKLIEQKLDFDGHIAGQYSIRKKINNSIINQKIRIYKNSRRIDFITEVDWKETYKLLKVAFPSTIRNYEAKYEIQYGHVKRNTHSNTSWDFAKFEVPAQKWADLSCNNYGITLMNDCKYGYDCKENVIRLSLLRSPRRPDPKADIGTHHFTYSIYPHSGNIYESDFIKQSYLLNRETLYTVKNSKNSSTKKAVHSFASIQSIDTIDSVIIENIKEAEDGNGVIIRLYESKADSSNCELELANNYTKATLCNLMEKNIEQLEIKNKKIFLSFRPFEIKSIRIEK